MTEQEANQPDGPQDGRDNPDQSEAGPADDRLDWLDGSFSSPPVEELPTLHWPSGATAEEKDRDAHETPPGAQRIKEQPAAPPRNVADAMAWLEQMARGQSAPIDEMPTLVTPPDDQRSDPSEVNAEDAIPDEQAHPESDSDPMAWLEQLAVGQVSPLEELPSVADRLLASEIVSQMDDGSDAGIARVYSAVHGPEQVAQAMSYLEQLAEAQGVEWSTVPLDLGGPVGSLEEALAVIDRIALLAAASATVEVPAQPQDRSPLADQPTLVSRDRPEEVQVLHASDPGSQSQATAPREMDHRAVALDQVEDAWDDLSARMPDDPQEALEWLATVAEEELSSGIVMIEADTLPPTPVAGEPEEQEAPPAEGPDAAETDMADFALDEMPDDPDEAMAWMRRLAASQPQQVIPPVRQRTDQSPAAAPLVEDEDVLDERPALPEHTLRTARNAVRKGDVATVTALYKALLDSGADAALLIPDLESAVERVGLDARLLRLLGDAYSQAGQLDKAVEVYRRGFDQL